MSAELTGGGEFLSCRLLGRLWHFSCIYFIIIIIFVHDYVCE